MPFACSIWGHKPTGNWEDLLYFRRKKEKYYGILLTSVRIHIYLVPVSFPRWNWKQLITIHIMKINGKSCVPFKNERSKSNAINKQLNCGNIEATFEIESIYQPNDFESTKFSCGHLDFNRNKLQWPPLECGSDISKGEKKLSFHLWVQCDVPNINWES